MQMIDKFTLILFIAGGAWAAVTPVDLAQIQQPPPPQASSNLNPMLQQAYGAFRNVGGKVANGALSTLAEVVDENKDLIRQRMVAGMTGRYFIPPPNPYAAANNGYPQAMPYGYANNSPYANFNNQAVQSYGNPPVNYSTGHPIVQGYSPHTPLPPSVHGYSIQQDYHGYPHPTHGYTSPMQDYPQAHGCTSPPIQDYPQPVTSTYSHSSAYSSENPPCCNDYDPVHYAPAHEHSSYFPFNMFGSECNSAVQSQFNKALLVGTALVAIGFMVL